MACCLLWYVRKICPQNRVSSKKHCVIVMLFYYLLSVSFCIRIKQEIINEAIWIISDSWVIIWILACSAFSVSFYVGILQVMISKESMIISINWTIISILVCFAFNLYLLFIDLCLFKACQLYCIWCSGVQCLAYLVMLTYFLALQRIYMSPVYFYV